jgi:hypothetical protein
VREITEAVVFHPGVWWVGHGEAVAGNTLLHLGRLKMVRLFQRTVSSSSSAKKTLTEGIWVVSCLSAFEREAQSWTERLGWGRAGVEARAVTRD